MPRTPALGLYQALSLARSLPFRFCESRRSSAHSAHSGRLLFQQHYPPPSSTGNRAQPCSLCLASNLVAAEPVRPPPRSRLQKQKKRRRLRQCITTAVRPRLQLIRRPAVVDVARWRSRSQFALYSSSVLDFFSIIIIIIILHTVDHRCLCRLRVSRSKHRDSPPLPPLPTHTEGAHTIICWQVSWPPSPPPSLLFLHCALSYFSQYTLVWPPSSPCNNKSNLAAIALVVEAVSRCCQVVPAAAPPLHLTMS